MYNKYRNIGVNKKGTSSPNIDIPYQIEEPNRGQYRDHKYDRSKTNLDCSSNDQEDNRTSDAESAGSGLTTNANRMSSQQKLQQQEGRDTDTWLGET